MADKMKKEKEMKKNKKETKANSSKSENAAGKNKMETLENKTMTENELRENSMETNVIKYNKEKVEKKNRKRKFKVEHCLESPTLKAHSMDCNKSVKFNSHIIEDNLKDVSQYDIQDLMEVYMTYVNYRNIPEKEEYSVNLSTLNRSLEKTFSTIFTSYEEWLESFMEAYEKRSDAKIVAQKKRNQGRRPGQQALPDARREIYLDVNSMHNILKDGFDGTVEPEVAIYLTGVMQCIATEVIQASINSARRNTPSGHPVTITPKDILRGLESDAELKDLFYGDNKDRDRKK